MPEEIDREKVIEGLKHCEKCLMRPEMCMVTCPYFSESFDNCPIFDDARRMLQEQEELVRCKDCKYAKPLNDQYLGCSCLVDGIDSDYVMTVKPESYCSWGEKAVKQDAEGTADGGGQEGGAGPEG